MNLTEWARTQGISRSTAYNWYHQGKMPVPTHKVGRLILVDIEGQTEPTTTTTNTIYARVSSHDQASDLDTQVARITQWCTDQDIHIDKIVTEIGSGLNGHRPKFKRLLSDPNATNIIVEHRDRLARFGTDYIEAALNAQGRRIIIMNNEHTDDDIEQDVHDFLTSILARKYGKRSAANRAKAATADE